MMMDMLMGTDGNDSDHHHYPFVVITFNHHPNHYGPCSVTTIKWTIRHQHLTKLPLSPYHREEWTVSCVQDLVPIPAIFPFQQHLFLLSRRQLQSFPAALMRHVHGNKVNVESFRRISACRSFCHVSVNEAIDGPLDMT